MKSINLISDANNIRMDAWLAGKLEQYSRSYLKKLIEQDLVTVDGKKVKTNYKLKLGEEVCISVPQPEKLSIEPEDIPLDIIYEDDYILVINKPKDMVVHPAVGNYSGTLVNAIMNYCGENLSDINGIIRPGIVHRLDKDTTGVLIIAKKNEAHKIISQNLKDRNVKREYLAIVKGIIKENTGRIDLPIGRHPVDRKKMYVNTKNGRQAITNFQVLQRFKNTTYIEVSLETGRTHQIRVHMSYIGHPIIGDEVYGGKQKNYSTNGQVLHAKLVGIEHPITKKYMEFEAPLPEYFINILDTEKAHP